MNIPPQQPQYPQPYYAPATMHDHGQGASPPNTPAEAQISPLRSEIFDPADADMASLQPLITKIASAAVLAASVLAILCVVQLVAFAGWLSLPAKVLSVLMVLVAAPLFFIGWRLRFARKWAGIVSLSGAGVLAVLSAGWTFYCWTVGYIALFGLLTPPASVVATILTAVSLSACDRATFARERLRAQGLDIGI